MLLADNAIDDDGDIILRRVQIADGRTRVFVNDQPVSVQTLMRDSAARWSRSTASMTSARWSTPRAHRALLDAFGGAGEGRRGAGGAVRTLRARRDRSARRAPRRHRARRARGRLSARRRRRTAEARPAARRGDRACRAPHRHDAGREDRHRYRARRRRLSRGTAFAGAAAGGRCAGWNARPPKRRRCSTTAVKALDDALIALDAARPASRAPRCAPPSSIPRELERTEERLFALRAAARKYSTPVDDLAALREQIRRRPRRYRRRRGTAEDAGSGGGRGATSATTRLRPGSRAARGKAAESSTRPSWPNCRR